MPNCSTRLAVALAAFLLFPAQYLLPSLYSKLEKQYREGDQNFVSEVSSYSLTEENLLPVDIFVSVALVLFGLIIYICEWIQRKLIEKRMGKLSEQLRASVERLDAWSTQQRRLAERLALVQGATTEYNLLLYLLVHNNHDICDPSQHFYNDHFNYDFI